MTGTGAKTKNEAKNMEKHSELVMYTTDDGLTKVNVTFDHDTVRLSPDQMVDLFQPDQSTISRHIRNIFEKVSLLGRQLLQILQQFNRKAKDRLDGKSNAAFRTSSSRLVTA